MAPIQALEIPVEVFIIFLENDRYYFSVRNLVDTLNKKFNETIQAARVRQICEALTARQRIVKKQLTPEGTTKPTNHYSINHDIPEISSDNIIKKHATALEILKTMQPLEMLQNGQQEENKLEEQPPNEENE